MAKLRELCDKAELKIPFEVWPMLHTMNCYLVYKEVKICVL